MAKWLGVKGFLSDARERAEEVVGLIQEIVEPVHPPFDPSRQMATCMMIGSSMSFLSGWSSSQQRTVFGRPVTDADLELAIFRGQESIPTELFHKRVEEFRKKHPSTEEPLALMHEKVYGTRVWEENGEKVEETVDENGLFRKISRMMRR